MEIWLVNTIKKEGKQMAYQAGLDIGSVMAKAVIMHEDKVLSYSIRPIGGNFSNAANCVLEEALMKAGLTVDKLNTIGTTGLGASFVNHPHLKFTDITCQSRGINYIFPHATMVIEIGDQSTRVIRITGKGRVAECTINDRCAAGSGRILHIMSRVLKMDIGAMGDLSVQATSPVRFSTDCSVFLETEIISRIAEGIKKADIIAGLHQAMAVKILSMIQKVKKEDICAFTGGGAKDSGILKVLQDTLGKELIIPQEPFITCAIGAALIAAEKTGDQNVT